LDVKALEKEREPWSRASVCFEAGSRAGLYVGAKPLKEYLEEVEERWVLRLGELLDGLDWGAFEAAYQPGGRPPLHPKRVVGLLMYGMVLQQASLRQMESLARRDVGAWWLTGGLSPDHTTLARFIARHEELVSTEFFIGLTRSIAKHLGLKASDLAIDGTVTMAASSAVNGLKREALEKARDEAKEASEAAQAAEEATTVTPESEAGMTSGATTPESPAAAKAAARVEALEAALRSLDARAEALKESGKPSDKLQVSPFEPEAVLQPLKRSNDYGFAYKPTVAAHPAGLIIGQNLSPSNETEHVPDLLAQHQKVFGGQPQRALMDSGFCTIGLLTTCVAMGIDVLSPTGQGGQPRRGRKGLFAKSLFKYDEKRDVVTCPNNAQMKPGVFLVDRRGNRYREFRTSACATCPLRKSCTSGKQRALKRFEGDELKDAMTEILTHPEARAAYTRRSVIVEPVFARFLAAGFVRFRRKGRRRARTEFALRCSAHNVALFVRRTRRSLVVFFAMMRPDASWRLVVIGLNAAP